MLTGIEFPEIFIGVVAPVGVDVGVTVEELNKYFQDVGYDVHNVKVTDAFKTLARYIPPALPLSSAPYYDRIKSHIAYGNQSRREFSDNSILGVAAVSLISQARRKGMAQTRSPGSASYSHRVYIVNQFKRREEIDLMRQVYGPLFFQISIFSRRDSRVLTISKKISAQRQYGDEADPGELARGLVAQDENEAKDPFGQRVGGVFHDADLIVHTESPTMSVARQIQRFGDLLFGSNTISPTKDEYGLYAAKVSALRTLDLSRQVGAAIFSQSGEVLAQGSNEVPKAGGGTYWSDDLFDAREYVLKEDANDVRKRLVAREMFALLKQGPFREEEFDAFLARPDVKSSMMMDVIEYGRIVHAEMNAITDAARLGHALKDSTLYCTTFPCHLCAKHIVASGIGRVVYLEPYPKSLAPELHKDSIRVDGASRGKFAEYPVVEFQHFFGITPRRYRELFERGKRKNAVGELVEFSSGVRRPIVRIVQPFYVESENIYIAAGFSALRAVSRSNH